MSNTRPHNIPPPILSLVKSGVDIDTFIWSYLQEITRRLIQKVLQVEVESLLGREHPGESSASPYRVTGNFPERVKLGDKVLRLSVPRLVHVETGEAYQLESFQAIQQSSGIDDLLAGNEAQLTLFTLIVSHDYRTCVSMLLKMLGLNQLSLYLKWLHACEETFVNYASRSLANQDFMAFWFDRTLLKAIDVCVCLGITPEHNMVALGFVRVSSTNQASLFGLELELAERNVELMDDDYVIIRGEEWFCEAVSNVFPSQIILLHSLSGAGKETENRLPMQNENGQEHHTPSHNNGVQAEPFDLNNLETVKNVLAKGKERLKKDQLFEIATRLLQTSVNAYSNLEDVYLTLKKLGVNDPRDAPHMLSSFRDQLEELYADKEKLQELGVTEFGEVVTMVRSMEEQLKILYREKEISSKAMEDMENADTFQNLENLYAERELLMRELNVNSIDVIPELLKSLEIQVRSAYEEKELLQRELSVSSTDELIEIVKGMESQLKELYADRSELAEFGLEETHNAASMIKSMQEQLADLYNEKQTLANAGWASTTELLEELAQLKNELARVKGETNGQMVNLSSIIEENEQLREAMDRLQEKFGVSDPALIIELVDSLRAQLEDFYKELDALEADKAISLDNSPSIIHHAKLQDLEGSSEDDLNNLTVGVIKLDDDGNVLFHNERASELPGVSNSVSIVGENFFKSVAPTTNNRLFFGRFIQGVREGKINVRFRYTYVHPNEQSRNFVVHLHRKPEQHQNWILLKQI